MLSLFLLLVDEESERNKFEYIYRKYGNDMYKICLKEIGNPIDAEEIVSDALLAILENIKIIKTDNETALKAYLFRIVKNKCHDRRRNSEKLDISIENIDGLADETNIEAELAEKEEKEIILNIILKMPKIYRYVLYFRYNENYPIRSIAKLFSLSERNTKKLLNDGVRFIITALRKAKRNERS